MNFEHQHVKNKKISKSMVLNMSPILSSYQLKTLLPTRYPIQDIFQTNSNSPPRTPLIFLMSCYSISDRHFIKPAVDLNYMATLCVA